MNIHCKYDELMPVHKLKPHPKNRNKHPDDQIERLAKILKYQGIRAPIVVSKRSNKIVKGHGTVMAIKANQWDTAPIVYQDFDDDDQEWLFVQSDNAIANWAELDIKGINADLSELGPFDIDLLGIKDFTVTPEEKELGDEEATPEVRETDIKLGDLFQLGDHRLLCGDSSDGTQIEKLMGNEKADMVFTDPPYNVAGKNKGIAASAPTNKQMKKLMACDWDKDFDFDLIKNSLLKCISTNCSVYVCTSSYVAPKIWKWMEENFDFHGYCVWSKPNPFPSLMKRHWAFNTELVCYATKGKHVFHYPETGNALSVWTIPIGEGGLHPTQKPLAVPTHAITHSSNPNQIIVDLFGGSGTTLIACEKMNRKCFMMELDPQYCQVIIDRWEQYTGKKAVKHG